MANNDPHKWDYAGRDLRTATAKDGDSAGFAPDTVAFTSGDMFSPLLTFSGLSGCSCGSSSGRIDQVIVTECVDSGSPQHPSLDIWLLNSPPSGTLPVPNLPYSPAVGAISPESVLGIVSISNTTYYDIDAQTGLARAIRDSQGLPVNYITSLNYEDELYVFAVTKSAVTYPVSSIINISITYIKD